MTNKEDSNDISSDEDRQNGQCDLDLRNVLLLGSGLATSMESSCLTTKHISCAGRYILYFCLYIVLEIIVIT